MATCPVPSGAPGIVVDRYDDPREAARAGWDELVVAVDAPVFYSAGYLAAYHDAPLGDLERFGYLVVRRAPTDVPLAVVPAALYRRADPTGTLRLVHPGIDREPALLSHVWHCYDTRVVGATGRPEVVRAAVDALRELAAAWGARWFGLVNVEQGSPSCAALVTAGLAGRHLVDRFSVDLAGVADFDGYLQRLRPRARANLRRNRRRAHESGLTTATGSPAASDLAEIAALCARTAARFGSTGFYPPETFARFVQTLGHDAHVIEIRQAGRLVAAGVCLVDQRRFHTWTCGVDYDIAGNASPYALLFTESVELALRLGRRELEGGRGNPVFKQRHGLAVRRLAAHVAPV